MGYLIDMLCCCRRKSQDPICSPCAMGTPIEKGFSKRRRNTIPKRPKTDVLYLRKYLQYPPVGTSVFVPIEIHEPLSFLQKLAEPFEYSYLLDDAARAQDGGERTKYIAVFSHIFALKICERTSRPFDALLGETFELDRTEDLGFKFIAEQISIAPSIAAVHCVGSGWICQYSFEFSVNVQAKYISINPDVHMSVVMKDHNCEFIIPLNLNFNLHNILFGETYFDVVGPLEIAERRGSDKYACRIEYLSKFCEKNNSTDLIGSITRNMQTLMNIRGYWDKGLEVRYQHSPSGTETSDWDMLWEYRRVARNREETYYFTNFAVQLNEMELLTAPTDSRLRSDIRDLENGKIKSGNTHKKRLEEKQLKRVSSSWNKEPSGRYKPTWFSQSETGDWAYNGEYWQCKQSQDWSRCPNIF